MHPLLVRLNFDWVKVVALIDEEDEIAIPVPKRILHVFKSGAVDAVLAEQFLKLLDTLFSYADIIVRPNIQTVDEMLACLDALIKVEHEEALLKK